MLYRGPKLAPEGGTTKISLGGPILAGGPKFLLQAYEMLLYINDALYFHKRRIEWFLGRQYYFFLTYYIILLSILVRDMGYTKGKACKRAPQSTNIHIQQCSCPKETQRNQLILNENRI